MNQDTWYTGTTAVNRCDGANPCTPPTCDDWNGLPSDQRTRCGDAMYIAHRGGLSNTSVSAKTISINGGWQTQRWQDVVHADQLAASCPYHPQPLAVGPGRQRVHRHAQDRRPVNDPLNPGNIVNPPDPDELTVPVAGENGCPSGARVPTGTLASPAKLAITGLNGALRRRSVRASISADSRPFGDNRTSRSR